MLFASDAYGAHFVPILLDLLSVQNVNVALIRPLAGPASAGAAVDAVVSRYVQIVLIIADDDTVSKAGQYLGQNISERNVEPWRA